MFSKISDFIKSNQRILFYILVGLQIVLLLGMAGTRLFPLLFGKRILLKPLPVDPNDFFRGEYVRFRYEISSVQTEEAAVNETIMVMIKKDGRFWKLMKVLKKGERAVSSGPDTLFIKGWIRDTSEHRVLVLENFEDVSTPGWVADHPEEVRKFSRLQYYRYPDFEKNDMLYITLEYDPWTSAWVMDWQYTMKTPVQPGNEIMPDNSVVVSARVSDIRMEYDADVEYGIESWFVPEGEAIHYERDAIERMAVEVAVDPGGNAVISRVFIDDKPVSY